MPSAADLDIRPPMTVWTRRIDAWRCLSLLGVVLVMASLTTACRCGRELVVGSVSEPSARPGPRAAPPQHLARLALLPMLPRCNVHHHGLLLDLGGAAERHSRGFSWGPFEDTEHITTGATTSSRILFKTVAFGFWLDEPLEGAVVGVRGRGGRSSGASVYIDDHRLGSVRLGADDGVATTGSLSRVLEPGHHTVRLRFFGRADPKADEVATLDWLRIGASSDVVENYAPPTRGDVLEDIALGGEPARALVLRGASRVQCVTRVPEGARVRVKVGLWGSGEGVAEIRARVDGEPPVVLAERKLVGGDDARWLPLDLPLDEFRDRLVAIELVVPELRGAGRMAFGNPELVRDEPKPEPTPRAKQAVVVVLSGLERTSLPPWGTAATLPALADIARSSVVFPGYRTHSTVVGSVMASLLTGRAADVHVVEDPSAALGTTLPTISQVVRQGGGAAGFFTSVPATFAPFGFGRGWDRYEAFSPVSDVAATEPFKHAATFLSDPVLADRSSHLVVLHARGGHPPWDLSKQEVMELEPAEYSGVLDARRGGVTLAEIRSRSRTTSRRLTSKDWVRLRALQRAALEHQERALARLVTALEKAGTWNDTLFVVMGDVAIGPPPFPPFEAAPPLDETRLMVPLFVRFPGDARAGERPTVRVSTEDIAATLLDGLGFREARFPHARSLYALASAGEALTSLPAVATLGDEYSVRWGNWLIHGVRGRAPALCRLDVDPSCATDVFAKYPIVASGMWRAAFVALAAPPGKPGEERRVAASIDEATGAALRVWGD